MNRMLENLIKSLKEEIINDLAYNAEVYFSYDCSESLSYINNQDLRLMVKSRVDTEFRIWDFCYINCSCHYVTYNISANERNMVYINIYLHTNNGSGWWEY